MALEKKFNHDQLKAITHRFGPLLIVAGAGTGKTTVITERVKWLIQEKLALPDEILCLTFTEKAAVEMEERLDLILPYGYTQMWVTTFHSFCDRILRDDGLHLGLSPNFRLLTPIDSVALIQKHFFALSLQYFRPLGNPFKFVESFLSHFDRLADEDITPNQYLQWAKARPSRSPGIDLADSLDTSQYLELAQACVDYARIKAAENALDFSDLVSYTIALFRTRPNILRRYLKKFKFVLVDEYQDTNYAQNQLVNLVAGSHQNLTVVADDDQSIYRWRGAALSNVVQFRHLYPTSKIVTLTKNYRSSQVILDAAYRLIQHNNPDRLEVKEGITKKLISSSRHPGPPIEFFHFDNSTNEADAVASTIRKLTPQSHQLGDIAILVRANAHAEPFIRALNRHGIPHQLLGPGRLFQQPEIKDLIAYLIVLNNLHHDPAFYRVLSMDIFNIPAKDLALITLYAKKHHLPLFSAAESDIGQSARHVTDLINRHLTLVPKATAGDILYHFLVDSDMAKQLLEVHTSADEVKALNISKFFNHLKSLEGSPVGATIPAVADWLELSTQIGESPQTAPTDISRSNAVNILTIHSAKGLEFPVVFLVNLATGRFPSLHRRDPLPLPEQLVKELLPQGDFHIQEERRLFYVGMTRAQRRLFFTASSYYGDGKRLKKPSPFIVESLGAQAPSEIATSLSGQLSASLPPPPPASLPPTLPISHISYSQIETFKDCPLHYRAKYLLNISSPPSAASTFGNTIHAVLKHYFSALQSKQRPDIEELLAIYWDPVGYKNQVHEKKYLARGQKFLKALANQKPDPTRKIICLEYPFRALLSSHPLLHITGKIDRVDELADGRIEIIDYKTSATQLSPKEAASDLQLSFYALAATLLPFPPFGKKPEVVALSLFYLDDQVKVTTSRTPTQLESAKLEIASWVEKISSSDFRCNRTEVCRYCDYRILCDLSSTM